MYDEDNRVGMNMSTSDPSDGGSSVGGMTVSCIYNIYNIYSYLQYLGESPHGGRGQAVRGRAEDAAGEHERAELHLRGGDAERGEHHHRHHQAHPGGEGEDREAEAAARQEEEIPEEQEAEAAGDLSL